MIKSKIEEVESIIEFPKLMVDKKDLIVLFSASSSGVVIKDEHGMREGEYSKRWSMRQFTDFNGSIILSNGSK